MAGKLDALRAVPLFASLDDQDLKTLLSACREKVLLKGETLFNEGDEPGGLLIVWRGSLKVHKIGERGREQILEIEGPGRSLAELPLLDGLPYPASCAAIEDSVVLTIPRQEFFRLLEKNPALSRAVIASLSRRLRSMVALVEEISLKAVRQRLAAFLLDQASGGATFDLGLTHQDLASKLGTVREIVSRTLARMAHDGALRMEGRRITILDRDRL